MRILFISDFALSRRGGIETHVTQLMYHLSRHSRVEEIAHFSSDDFGGPRIVGKRVVRSEKIGKKIADFKPDVVHVHGFASFFVSSAIRAARALACQTIYTPHYHPFATLRYPLLGRLFFNRYLRHSLQKVDALCYLSDDEKTFFAQYLAPSKLVYSGNGFDAGVFYNSKGERGHEVIFIGRNFHSKRLDFLMDQQEFFRKEGIRLHLVTDGRPEGIDQSVCELHNNLSGDELVALLNRVKVLVMPSAYEAFGIVALEALACGVLVCASSRVQVAHQFQDREYFGVFEYDNADMFRQTLLKLLLYYPEADQNRIKSDISSHSWENVAVSILNLYIEKIGLRDEA